METYSCPLSRHSPFSRKTNKKNCIASTMQCNAMQKKKKRIKKEKNRKKGLSLLLFGFAYRNEEM